MEYVDGEDLASLVRRIGRLPTDKAIQIARQLCAGLAVAHSRGITHRDLKPANVMLDGRGQARIMDFGLAGLAAGARGSGALAGTPAYMAPEQLAGGEVTARTDIYALGLVMYELLTGRPAFDAESRADLERMRQDATPAALSLGEGIDPATARLIRRCLETDPTARPASALAVSAALPGGDPLAAALAAGETPAPEVVAGAGDARRLSARAAWICLALLAAGLGALFWTASQTQLTLINPLKKSPDVLIAEARGLLSQLGYPEAGGDTSFGFTPMRGSDWPDIFFWYRESPFPLTPFDDTEPLAQPFDPPHTTAGMVRIWLGTNGRLEQLAIVPPTLDRTAGPYADPDWTPLLKAAGVEPASLKPAEPTWTPNVSTDTRAGWEGFLPAPVEIRSTWEGRVVEPRMVPVRLEAGAFHGRVVYFNTIWPWDKPPEQRAGGGTVLALLGTLVDTGWYLAVLIGGVLLARNNLNAGRGDRMGAFRLAMFVLSARILMWVFGGHHVLARYELALLIGNLSEAIYIGVFVWILYLALEPYYRRFWPGQLISWVRLLDGRFRDPLVGRDFLIGALYGVALALIADLYHLLPRWLGLPPADWSGFNGPDAELTSLRGLRYAVATILGSMWWIIIFVLIGITFLLLLRIVLRRSWPAWALWMILGIVLFSPRSGPVLREMTTLIFVWVLGLLVLVRSGILSLLAGNFFAALLGSVPLTWDLSRWYAGGTLVVLAAVAALVIWAFIVSRAGRPLFALDAAGVEPRPA